MRLTRVAALALVAVLAGCSGDGGNGNVDASPSRSETASGSPSESGSTASVEAAEKPRRPKPGKCYRLSYAAAVSPTVSADPVPCGREHTAETFHVGTLDTVIRGRRLAVDSRHVQRQVATECPDRLAGFVGGTAEQRRLSMIRSVWFTPTLHDADAGADWFRCDAVVLERHQSLSRLRSSLAGVLDTAEGRARFGVCGTAEPGSREFRRVVCARPHSWRAVRTVQLPEGRYPGEEAARQVGEGPCRAAGEAVADDPLDFRWSYEWPDESQWRAGQTYGLCWVPD